MKILTSILFFFFLSTLNSQTMYLDSVSKVRKRTFTYSKSDDQKLKLDFYKPRKFRDSLPLIVYVHGGGFSGGKRDDDHIVEFANFMANRGFAVASVSYRLTMQKLGFGCKTKAEDKIDAFNNASEDVSMAINYMIENNRKFKIDLTKIILVGSSAGAETVLNLAYVYKNDILPNYFKFAGVISMAGALTSTKNITKETAIPTQLFHGTDDKLVPYNIAPHHYCKKTDLGFLTLYGSKAIADKLKKINESFYLYSIKDGGHSWASRPMIDCTKEILDFLYFDVLKEEKKQTEIYN